MTRKELDAAKNALREQCRGRQMTKAEALLNAEYSCRDMMICIFAYDGTAGITNEDGFNFKRYLSPYVQTLGRKRYDRVREDIHQGSSRLVRKKWNDGHTNHLRYSLHN